MSKGASKDIYYLRSYSSIRAAHYWPLWKSKEKKNIKCNSSYTAVIDYNRITKAFLTYYFASGNVGTKEIFIISLSSEERHCLQYATDCCICSSVSLKCKEYIIWNGIKGHLSFYTLRMWCHLLSFPIVNVIQCAFTSGFGNENMEKLGVLLNLHLSEPQFSFLLSVIMSGGKIE